MWLQIMILIGFVALWSPITTSFMTAIRTMMETPIRTPAGHRMDELMRGIGILSAIITTTYILSTVMSKPIETIGQGILFCLFILTTNTTIVFHAHDRIQQRHPHK